MAVTESVLWEVGNALFSEIGKAGLRRRLREGGVTMAQEHLIRFVQYVRKNHDLDLAVAEEYYRKLEATPEQLESLRQARK